MYKFYIAKYRTIKKNCTIVDPLFPSFLHHHCLQILYTTNFLRENVFIEVQAGGGAATGGGAASYDGMCAGWGWGSLL